VKFALLDPLGTETEAGTVRAVLLLDNPTAKAPVALLFRVTEQVMTAPEATLAGQFTEVKVTGAVSVSENVRVTPAAEAVRVAVTSAATSAAVAEKFAVVAAAGTETEAGAVTLALLLDNDTANPPARAADVNVTVHVDVAGPCTDAGVQDKVLNWGPAGTLTVAVRLVPPPDAVTVTLCAVAGAPAVAEKVAVVAPEPAVTDAGTVKAALLLESVTTNPPPPAALFKVTVQVPEVPGLMVAGQARAET
jgi:hypothetical protein